MKTLFSILTVLFLLLFSSCIEIEEEVSLKKDGSGDYEMSIDISKMMAMMGGFMAQEGGEMGELNKGFADGMTEAVDRLRKTTGISEVVGKNENNIVTISYDFASVDALNDAAGQGMSLTEGAELSGAAPAYFWTGKSFGRESISFEDLMGEMGKEEGGIEMMEMAKMMMGDATYTIIYNLPGKGKKVTNSKAVFSNDKKTVTLEIPLVDLMEERADLGNKVTFKKK